MVSLIDNLPKVPFCVTFDYFFYFLHIQTSYCHRLLYITLHTWIAFSDCYECHILERAHSIFDTTQASNKHTVDNHHLPDFCFCLWRASTAPALNHFKSGRPRPAWLFAQPPQDLRCFDNAEPSPWSVSSPNGATFSCSWASSWWSWRCCHERATRRGSPTSSASSVSLTPLVCQIGTIQQPASPEGMYMPTSPTYPKLITMETPCPSALRRPLW